MEVKAPYAIGPDGSETSPHKNVGGNKVDPGKPTPKKVWKPKARAAGQQSMSNDSIQDVIVRKFGSAKHHNPDEDAATAAQRASSLQLELGMDPADIKPCEDTEKPISAPRIPPQEVDGYVH